MANQVEIEILAKDMASRAFDSVLSSLKEIGTTQGLIAAGALTLGAAVVTGLNKAKDAAFKYDQEIKDMMLATGGTAEETSRLRQVLDDVSISYDTMRTAMKMAVTNGVEPNIESLARLSDEYLALEPGLERGQFLLDKFGKSGMEMARFMELGSDAIYEMNAAVDENLVITEEVIAQSEEYRKNVDELTDAWEGFKIMVGNEVIPVLNVLIPAMEKSSVNVREQIKWFEYLIPPIAGAHAAWLAYIGIHNENVKNAKEETAALKEQAGAVGNLGNAVKGLPSNKTISVTLQTNYATALGQLQNFGGFRAGGGPVDAGRSYMVGERGPERFTPNTGGTITPNNAGIDYKKMGRAIVQALQQAGG